MCVYNKMSLEGSGAFHSHAMVNVKNKEPHHTIYIGVVTNFSYSSFLHQERSVSFSPRSAVGNSILQNHLAEPRAPALQNQLGMGILCWAFRLQNRAALLWSALETGCTVWFLLKRRLCCLNFFLSQPGAALGCPSLSLSSPLLTSKKRVGSQPGSLFLYASLGEELWPSKCQNLILLPGGMLSYFPVLF